MINTVYTFLAKVTKEEEKVAAYIKRRYLEFAKLHKVLLDGTKVHF